MTFSMRLILVAIGFVATIISISAHADVRLPRIFADNMVLQQQTSVAVWGWAEPGEGVRVEGSWGREARTTANADGKWKLLLETPAYGGPYTVTLTGKNRIVLENVLIGEVWLAAGQSNLGWAVRNTFDGDAVAASANNPNLRIYRTARVHWHEPLEDSRDLLTEWSPAHPDSVATTSAVAYHFAAKLQAELDIPVGLIVAAYAGTPIEGWFPKDVQSDLPGFDGVMAELARKPARPSEKEAMRAYAEAYEKYEQAVAAGTASSDTKVPTINRPATLGHQYPGHIFNGLINPVRPFGIRGAIWYQGESNAKTARRASFYDDQLAAMIAYYRSTWHELSGGNVAKDFPFFFTQLPSWGPTQVGPVEGVEASWAVSREMMRRVEAEVENTGMAVTIDTGDEILLHPRNKKEIGIRHAYLALDKVYSSDIVGSGPKYESHSIAGDAIAIRFVSVGSGLIAARREALGGFAIAGEDRDWHWAEAKISGDKIVVSSPGVTNPVAVRYAWAMNPSQQNLLYNKEGIPASPFRTDDWPLFDADARELPVVFKPDKPENYESVDWDRPKMTQ